MLQLVKPSKQYYKQCKEMMDEWNMEGSRIAPWPYHTEELFEEMLNRVKEVEEGRNLAEFLHQQHTGYMMMRVIN